MHPRIVGVVLPFPERRRGQPCRLFSIWLATLFLTLAVPAAFAQHVANPFAGATVYVNPDYTKEVNSAVATLPAGSVTWLIRPCRAATAPTARRRRRFDSERRRLRGVDLQKHDRADSGHR